MPRKCRVSQLFYQLCLHDGSQCKQRFSTDLLIKLNFLDCASCCSGTWKKPAEFDAHHYTVIVLKILCAQGYLFLSLSFFMSIPGIDHKCLLSILPCAYISFSQATRSSFSGRQSLLRQSGPGWEGQAKCKFSFESAQELHGSVRLRAYHPW